MKYLVAQRDLPRIRHLTVTIPESEFKDYELKYLNEDRLASLAIHKALKRLKKLALENGICFEIPDTTKWKCGGYWLHDEPEREHALRS